MDLPARSFDLVSPWCSAATGGDVDVHVNNSISTAQYSDASNALRGIEHGKQMSSVPV